MARTAGVTLSEPTHVMLSPPLACMAWMKRAASGPWQNSTTTIAPLRRSTSMLDEKSTSSLTKLVEASTLIPVAAAAVVKSCMPEDP